ncbi:hypothetical protein TNCT_440411, partial [Trichonephila clavata]
MNLLPILSLYATYAMGFALEEQVVPGSCSKKCQKDSEKPDATQDFLLQCSCSSSCSKYRDCCFDSPYRDE